MMISAKLGLRNLTRNRWRSGLTLAAVAVAVGLMVWTLAMYEGWINEMVRGATAVETGQVQIHTAGYVENPRVYRAFAPDPAMLQRIMAVRNVRAISPRVKAVGLIGNEQRSQVAQIKGVDPQLEAAATPIRDAIVAGRWLSDDPAPYPAPREVVLGKGMAQQLGVGPGDTLVVFLEAADGSLGNDLLQVVGVVRTANTQVDRMAAYMHLKDAQYLTALGDQVQELAIRTTNVDDAEATADSIAAAIHAYAGTPGKDAALPDGELVVQSWQQIMPSVYEMILLFRRSYWIMYLLVYLVAAVGILNTQRMSAAERKREFGVMMAIGMRPRRMFRTLVVETAVLGLVGAAIGALGGYLLSLYYAKAGFDMSVFTTEATFSYMGVAFSDKLYFVLRPSLVIEPVIFMLLVAMVSGLWPAIKASRIDPAPTIAGRT
jgi:ABC-type lipoprotein release transport system permease subunit